MDVFIRWVRPDGIPGQAAEVRVDRAWDDIIATVPEVHNLGSDRGTDLTTGERDVAYWFRVDDLATAHIIRDHLALVAAIGQHPAAGTMTVVKGA